LGAGSFWMARFHLYKKIKNSQKKIFLTLAYFLWLFSFFQLGLILFWFGASAQFESIMSKLLFYFWFIFSFLELVNHFIYRIVGHPFGGNNLISSFLSWLDGKKFGWKQPLGGSIGGHILKLNRRLKNKNKNKSKRLGESYFPTLLAFTISISAVSGILGMTPLILLVYPLSIALTALIIQNARSENGLFGFLSKPVEMGYGNVLDGEQPKPLSKSQLDDMKKLQLVGKLIAEKGFSFDEAVSQVNLMQWEKSSVVLFEDSQSENWKKIQLELKKLTSSGGFVFVVAQTEKLFRQMVGESFENQNIILINGPRTGAIKGNKIHAKLLDEFLFQSPQTALIYRDITAVNIIKSSPHLAWISDKTLRSDSPLKKSKHVYLLSEILHILSAVFLRQPSSEILIEAAKATARAA